MPNFVAIGQTVAEI